MTTWGAGQDYMTISIGFHIIGAPSGGLCRTRWPYMGMPRGHVTIYGLVCGHVTIYGHGA